MGSTPDKGHFEINLAAQYTRFVGGSVGNVPSLEVKYGVLGNLEASIVVPMGLSQVSGVGTNVGFGDVEVNGSRLSRMPGAGDRPSRMRSPASGSEPRSLGAVASQASSRCGWEYFNHGRVQWRYSTSFGRTRRTGGSRASVLWLVRLDGGRRGLLHHTGSNRAGNTMSSSRCDLCINDAQILFSAVGT
jgi:hypothetical protein